MYKSGHTGLSLLLYSPILFVLLTYEYIMLASIGLLIILCCSSLPDLDFKIPKMKHRGYSHSLIGAFIASIPIGIFGYISYAYIASIIVSLGATVTVLPYHIGLFCFGMGFFAILSHYAGDIVTPSGIPILAPFSRKYYSLGLFYAKNRIANGGFFLLGLVAIVSAISYAVYIKHIV